MGGCKSSTLLYSDTGEGKTGQCGGWAKAVKKYTGKKSLMFTSEPGGLTTIADLIEEGLIDVLDISARPYASETVDMICNGVRFDANDWKKTIPVSSALFEEYGGFIYEGGTTFSDNLLAELAAKGAKNEIVGVEKAPQQYKSGETLIASNNQSHYGMAQGRIRKAINDSMRLPVHILWTCRELKMEDENKVSGFKEIYGPKLAGQVLTPHAPAWFGRTIHLDTVREDVLDSVTKKMVTKTVRKAFFKTHFYEGDRVPYIANPRLIPAIADQLPESVVLDADLTTMTWLWDKIEELKAELRISKSKQ